MKIVNNAIAKQSETKLTENGLRDIHCKIMMTDMSYVSR